MKKCGRGPDNTPLSGSLWQSLLLVIMVMGSGAQMWSMMSVPPAELPTSAKGPLSGTIWVVEAGVRERTAGQVRVLLMLSGNVERNPGPTTETYDVLVSGLADLVGQAPAGMRDVLCAWSPDKASNEIAADLNSKKFTLAVLQPALAWLLNRQI